MPVDYVPRVIVKFKDDEQIPYDSDDAVEQYFATGQAGPWLQLKMQFNNVIKIERLFTSVSPERIRQLDEAVRRLHPNTTRSNLLTYVAVTCPGVDRKEVVAAFRNKNMWPNVLTAYVQGGPGPSPGVVLGPGEAVNQEYLDPAPPNIPGGIDARYAWTITGGDGGGGADLQFVDIEQGWVLNHEDLPPGITLIFGNNRLEQGHGTCVLGIVTAIPGNSGAATSAGLIPKDCAGIAPRVATKLVASSWAQNGTWRYSVADAILAAYSKMKTGNILKAGDVILLEAQTDMNDPLGENLPIEVELAEFDAIKDATDAGIVVIEAAGNGAWNTWQNNLDNVIDADYATMHGDGHIFRKAVRDSGAIIVAEAYNDTRGPISNFGSRIDCYAWGDNVYTTGFSDKPPLPPSQQTSYIDFTGSSSAAAIVAGAALALQGIKKANSGSPYTNDQLRTILRNWQNGTVSENSLYDPANWNFDKIGVMPDLKKITVNENLVPDIYIRDNTTDDGLPHQGNVSMSPDIILLNTQFDLRPDPDRQAAQNTYGEGNANGNENDPALSVEPVQGIDHYIYLRLRNRGGAGAENVEAKVYWSPVATLLDPNFWNRVDQVADPNIPSVVIPQVPKGDILTVSASIIWPGTRIPVTGHYCFVALVGNAADPAPVLSDFMTWPNFINFIRVNNNVTWRNFNVVEYNPISLAYNLLDFFIAGPWDGDRAMNLEVIARLPPGSQITLQAPTMAREILNGFSAIGPIEEDIPKQILRVNLSPDGSSKGTAVQFAEGFRAKSQLLVNIPQQFRHNSYEVCIRQLFQNIEVGRITWRLKPKT